MVRPYQLPEGFRTNDGKIDMEGNFWWSTMDDNHGERTGDVFRTRPNLETERMLSGIHIPNTVSFSPDGKTLYMADSRLQTIFAHETADLSKAGDVRPHRRRAGQPRRLGGRRPGLSLERPVGRLADRALFAQGRDRHASSRCRSQQPSSCAFGGEDMTTLFVTSAWDELPLATRAQQPLAGNLFAIETGVKGLALPLFAG